MKTSILLFLFFIITPTLIPASAETFNLRMEDHELLNKGELILRKNKIEGNPWPEITIISKISATPTESMAVFYAYHEHKDFLPDLLTSTPSKYISPYDLHINFEMKIPWPMKNSRYTTGNKLSHFGDGGYRIKWYHVASTSSKTTRGFVIFTPYEKGTLFIYRTFVKPKSKLAGIFKKRMVKEVRKSVMAIISRIESVKSKNKNKISEYIDALKRSLKGEYIYKNIPGVKGN